MLRLRFRWLPLLLLLGLSLSLGLAGCRSYQGPQSDHFDGTHFFNPWKLRKNSMFDLIRWKWTSIPAEWPEWVENPKEPLAPEGFREGNVQVVFVNHASFLIQIGGLNILADPVWSERTSPFSWIGPKRVRDPGIPFEKLPRIDAVLVTHNHYDHMDVPTLKRVSDAHPARIFVPLGDKEWLEDEGIKRVEQLDWWQTVTLNDEVKLHFAPSQHWSARGLHDRDRSLWGAFAIEYKGKMVYVAGDTGYGPHFAWIAERLPPVELALLPIGAYEPRWFMEYQHMNPSDTVRAFGDLKAHYGLGKHFGCWQLTDESIDQPSLDLKTATAAVPGLEEKFLVPEIGAVYHYTF